MIPVVFYICVLLQSLICYEIDENEIDVPEIVSPDDYDEYLSPITNTSALDHENVIASENVEVADKYFNEKETEEQEVSFVGPVKARGSVTIAANFGYEAPGPFSYPTFFSIKPRFPSLFTQFYFSPSPFEYPMPFTFPYMPLVATYFPNFNNSEDFFNKIQNHDEAREKNSSINPNTMNKGSPARKDIYVETNPHKKAKNNVNLKAKSIGKIDLAKLVEEISLEDLRPVVFLDEDYTDDLADEVAKDVMKEKDSEAKGVVFGGFIPASGSVRIAGRFK